MLRFLLWRLLGLLALLVGFAAVGWLLSGGPGRVLRAAPARRAPSGGANARRLLHWPQALWDWAPLAGMRIVVLLGVAVLAMALVLLAIRWAARSRRSYVRLRLEPYRTDQASAEAVVRMHEALHKRLLLRWWRRLLLGQPSFSLEVHHECSQADGASRAWLALSCPVGVERLVEAAVRTAYPNCRLSPAGGTVSLPSLSLLRLKKDVDFTRRVKSLDRFEHDREPAMNRLLTVMGACRAPVLVQLALTPAPLLLERIARRRFKLHEAHLSRERREHLLVRDRSLVGTQELADLRLPGRDALLEQVLGNLSVVIAHRQVVPASAELLCALAGTRGVWRTSRQDGGRTSRTRTREARLSVEEVMNLAPGCAAAIAFGQGSSSQIVRVFSEREEGSR